MRLSTGSPRSRPGGARSLGGNCERHRREVRLRCDSLGYDEASEGVPGEQPPGNQENVVPGAAAARAKFAKGIAIAVARECRPGRCFDAVPYDRRRRPSKSWICVFRLPRARALPEARSFV